MSQNTVPRDRDEGFTLTELLVSIVIIGLLSGVLVGVFTVVMRSVPTVDARVDEARTLQGVVTWLPQDVDSTPPNGFDQSASAVSGCTLSPGVNLLKMEWMENVGTPTRFIANYRAVPVAAGIDRIERITCSGTAAGTLGNARSLVVSSELPALPVGWAPGDLPMKVDIRSVAGEVELVTFQVRSKSGKIVRTDSAPKNPAVTLVPVTASPPPPTIVTTTTVVETTTTTTPPTTIFGETTTTAAPTTTLAPPPTTLPPCVVTSMTLSPTSMRNVNPDNGGGNPNVGVLRRPVTLTIQTAGVCGSLEARPDTGASGGELFHNASQAGATYTVVLPGYPQGSGELWADGNRAIGIYGPLATVSFGSILLSVE